MVKHVCDTLEADPGTGYECYSNLVWNRCIVPPKYELVVSRVGKKYYYCEKHMEQKKGLFGDWMSVCEVSMINKSVWDFVVHHRKQPYDVFIGRPAKWSNPFSSKKHASAKFKVETKAEALYQYALWVLSQPDMIKSIKETLSGRVLGCWCAPNRCHGELLAAIANDLPLPNYAPHPKKPVEKNPTLF